MSASKLPGSESGKLGPLAVRSQARRAPEGTTVVQEKVLADIRHELGNFFHKLYYWSDYLKEKSERSASDVTAAEMLERTIHNLEDFLKVSLEYFRPTQLSCVRMHAPELIEGLLFQLRSQMNGTAVSVRGGEGCRDAAVLIDPGHLSRALAVAVRHLGAQVGADSSVRIDIERSTRRDCPGLEVVFTVQSPNESSPLFRTSEASIQWAVAQKVVALHGGELSERALEGGTKTVSVFLPLSPAGVVEV